MTMNLTDRTLLAAALAVATLAGTGCELLMGPQRSRARVSETESLTRYEGSTSAITRREIEYRESGLIDEITETTEGDFIRRIELGWDADDQLEDVTVIYDETTDIYELEWERGLLTQVDKYNADSNDGLNRTEISYFNGDARYLEKMVGITETENTFAELRTLFGYDESSRVATMKATSYTEYDSGFGEPSTTESKSETEMRYDADKGWLERVTLVTEVPNLDAAPPVEDTCATNGYYGDGVCDDFCLNPDPDCGDTGEPNDPPSNNNNDEWDRNTSLWSMSYDDEGRLEEVLAPGGQLTEVQYDDEGRVEETESIDDGYTSRVEYQYEDGQVRGELTFSPAVPYGQFYDVEGESFGTVHVLQLLGLW
jgi:YD repeat-containing protein